MDRLLRQSGSRERDHRPLAGRGLCPSQHGNLVVHTDLNCLSVMQFAVEILRVKTIMVVGHYGCSGVQAVAEHRSTGLADNWLRHMEDLAHKHAALLEALDSDVERARRLCELNVIEQVCNVCRTTIVRRAWYRGSRLGVHGLVYGSRTACCAISASRSAAQRHLPNAMPGQLPASWTDPARRAPLTPVESFLEGISREQKGISKRTSHSRASGNPVSRFRRLVGSPPTRG